MYLGEMLVIGVSLLGMGATLLVMVDNDHQNRVAETSASHAQLNLGKLK